MEKIDQLVNNIMQDIANKGRGQVLSLVGDDDKKITIEIKESLRPTDESENPTQYRNHILHDQESFLAFTNKYGDPKTSLVIIGKEKVVLVIDEKANDKQRGLREKITFPLEQSDDWKEWMGSLDKATDHRSLLRFLSKHEHNLKTPELLQTLRTLKMTNTVNLESDVQEDGESIGIAMKTNGGETIKKFKKTIPICLAVLDPDVLDDNLWVNVEIKLDVSLPKEAHQGPAFTLSCSTINQIYAKRVQKEAKDIRTALTDAWLVVMGDHDETDRSYVRGDIVQRDN